MFALLGEHVSGVTEEHFRAFHQRLTEGRMRVHNGSQIVDCGTHLDGHGAFTDEFAGSVAIEMGATVHDLGAIVHPHPTLSETLMEGAEVFFGHSTHVFTKKREH